ncbi:MAG TPA: hypothetical protein PKY50_12225 [Candidatus Competibacter sp.]|nr:hypothetical protein [Candidatus Competibacter sp.]
MSKTTSILLAGMLLTVPTMSLTEELHANEFTVQAYSFSANSFMPPAEENCAAYLKNLLMSNSGKYNLLSTMAVQGPPGVVYTLQDNKGEIAIIKCGLHGASCGGGEEGSGGDD